jgi:uncharacterized protein (DUF433 family)
MDWCDRIVTDPETLFGKPRIRGTRIGVDLILDLLASGWNEAQILESYPHLTQADLQAIFAFVRDCCYVPLRLGVTGMLDPEVREVNS